MTEKYETFGSAIVGKSPCQLDVLKLIGKTAQTDDSVMVTGESGTGKELVAKEIHRKSGRRDQPFVVVNCGAIPENLAESLFFRAFERRFYWRPHR